MALEHTETKYATATEVAILDLLNTRKPGASICPSEAARIMFNEDWREQMPHIREVAGHMARQGQIEICQKGLVIDPASARGPIRLRLPKVPGI